MESLFTSDLNINKLREQYLSHKLKSNKIVSNHGSFEEEFKGIDYYVNGQTVDMKWTDVFRPTYAVEISYFNEYNQQKIGWFMDPQHQTQWALFVEANKEHPQIHAFSFKLEELRKLIFANVSYEQIAIAHDQLRNNTKSFKHEFPNSKLKLVKSTQLKENPINLVIPQTWYHMLPSFVDESNLLGSYSEYEDFIS